MRFIFTLLLLLAAASPAQAAPPKTITVSQFGASSFYTPSIAPIGFIALLSPSTGWNKESDTTAAQLTDAGYMVLGLDIKNYYATRKKSKDTCIFPSGLIEEQAQDLQKDYHLSKKFFQPIVVGLGDSGSLATTTVMQALTGTYGGAIAPQFCASVPSPKPMCPGTRIQVKNKVYTPLDITKTEKNVNLFMAQDKSCAKEPNVWNAVPPVADSGAFITDSLEKIAAKAHEDVIEGLGDLPLTYLPARRTDWLVVFISGDGGWRDIDRQIGNRLQEAGYAVVGLDSLHFFWQEKTPQETAAALDRIISTVAPAWHKRRVALMGYSFGADVLPLSVAHMKTAGQIRQMAFIGFSRYALFEITAGSFLGDGDMRFDNMAGLEKLPGKIPTLCIYGENEDDDDTLCRLAPEPWIEKKSFPGGHHFNEDYEGLTKAIISRL